MIVTIKDVAKAAGVSVATVSRVLNQSAPVSEPIAKAVRDTVKAMNYRPNSLGRYLRKCATKVILVTQPESEHSLYCTIIRGMQETASEMGYDIITASSNHEPEVIARQMNLLYNRTVDGAIFLGTQLKAKELNKLTENYHIALCCEGVDGANVLTVTVNDEQAGFDATEALINKGHTKIALIATDGISVSSLAREKGYYRALEKHNIKINPEYIYKKTYDVENGVAAIEKFLALKDRPTAVFAISDLLAASAIKAAHENGLIIGKDISIIGFDNITLCNLFVPSISTVAQPCAEMGKFVITKLIENINSEEPDDTKYYPMPHKVILRQSTGD